MRSAQRIDRGDHQLQRHQGRHWRTRADPLADVWESVLVPMLEKAPQLDPQTLLLHLEEIRPGQEWYRRKRTLQRRVDQWRALHGPGQEVMFLQEHRAGVLGISDFTLLKGEPITVAGMVLEHRLFHFRLPYSGWCHVEVIHGGVQPRHEQVVANKPTGFARAQRRVGSSFVGTRQPAFSPRGGITQGHPRGPSSVFIQSALSKPSARDPKPPCWTRRLCRAGQGTRRKWCTALAYFAPKSNRPLTKTRAARINLKMSRLILAETVLLC